MPIGHSNAIGQSKWLKLVGKCATNASSHLAKFATYGSGAILWPIFQLIHTSGAIWWQNLELVPVAPSGCQFSTHATIMQVAPSCGQFFNSCKWRHLVAKFGTNASGATISWRDNSSLDAIPWVRCASGNVFYTSLYSVVFRFFCWYKFVFSDVVQPFFCFFKNKFVFIGVVQPFFSFFF